MKHLGKHFTPWPLTCSGEYPGENGSKAALVDPRFYTRCPFTPRFEETRGNMCTLPQPKTQTRFIGKTSTPSPCATRTGGRRSPPSSLRELGVRFSPAFRRNTAGRRPRVPEGTRFTGRPSRGAGRPGRSAPLTGRGIEPRDLRSRPVEDPGCRKAPGSRAARAERPSRGGGYAITGET